MSRKDSILTIVRKDGPSSASIIHKALAQSDTASLVTVRRYLQQLVRDNTLKIQGGGRSTVYALTNYGKLKDDVDAEEYLSADPDLRNGERSYNSELIPALTFPLFSDTEKNILEEATTYYHEKNHDVSLTIRQKELERFVIELSWKSSKIEGNTYTLLDTEKLILEAKEAPGHDHLEAQMILNHKTAFEYIHRHASQFKSLSRAHIEDVHKLLVADLGVTHNLRKKPVGVTGSVYRPLDNEYQITEAVNSLITTVNNLSDAHAKALVTLIGISYIQPFEDGNKRTARLMANALLRSHDLAPLSYRSVTEESYRTATLVFYELNSLVPFRKMFVSQYDFAARNYLAG